METRPTLENLPLLIQREYFVLEESWEIYIFFFWVCTQARLFRRQGRAQAKIYKKKIFRKKNLLRSHALSHPPPGEDPRKEYTAGHLPHMTFLHDGEGNNLGFYFMVSLFCKANSETGVQFRDVRPIGVFASQFASRGKTHCHSCFCLCVKCVINILW